MNYLEFWYEALGKPIGIVVETNSPQTLIQKLYAARKEAFDTDLDGLSIIQSPTEQSQIWIAHKRLSNGKAE